MITTIHSLQEKRRMSEKQTAPKPVEDMCFEEAMAELEQIVARLEQGQVPLEESIAIYERGERLKQRCEALLREAEARIEKITLDAEGKPVGTEPLDVSEE